MAPDCSAAASAVRHAMLEASRGAMARPASPMVSSSTPVLNCRSNSSMKNSRMRARDMMRRARHMPIRTGTGIERVPSHLKEQPGLARKPLGDVDIVPRGVGRLCRAIRIGGSAIAGRRRCGHRRVQQQKKPDSFTKPALWRRFY